MARGRLAWPGWNDRPDYTDRRQRVTIRMHQPGHANTCAVATPSGPGRAGHNGPIDFTKPAMTFPRLPILSLLETRVLGVLCEKQHTVPDTYPLSLNALVAGCNQKTSRHPLIEASEAEVQAAIDSLKGPALVIESSGGRVTRYAHNMGKALQLPAQSVALLTVLMLRGPQTAGELRISSERLHKFADISAVEGFLQELAERPEGAMVVELPRQPGARENRWAHLLGGAPDIEDMMAASPSAAQSGADVNVSEIAALKVNVARLQSDVEALNSLVGKLCAELGIER